MWLVIMKGEKLLCEMLFPVYSRTFDGNRLQPLYFCGVGTLTNV